MLKPTPIFVIRYSLYIYIWVHLATPGTLFLRTGIRGCKRFAIYRTAFIRNVFISIGLSRPFIPYMISSFYNVYQSLSLYRGLIRVLRHYGGIRCARIQPANLNRPVTLFIKIITTYCGRDVNNTKIKIAFILDSERSVERIGFNMMCAFILYP